MSRFTAVGLDLSRLDTPLAIRGLDYELVLSERLAYLRGLLDAAGIGYDALGDESDAGTKLQETDAYRELLGINAINDAVRGRLIAFATGADLDHLGAFYRTPRHPGEGDEDYRRRIILAPEAFSSAGTPGAYMYHALAADPRVRHADVWTPEPGSGKVIVAIQSREGRGQAPDDLIKIVHAHLSADDIKPVTDILTVRSAVIVDYSVSVTAYVLPGPSPSAVRDDIEASITAMGLMRKTPARDVPLSAVIAAASIGPVDRVVVHSPTADVATGRGEVPNLTGVAVAVEVYDG